jgi:G3E family GTPase
MNAAAKVYRTRDAVVEMDRILNVGGFNLDRALEVDPQFMEPEYPFEWAGAYALPAGTHALEIGHGDDEHDHEGHDHVHDEHDHAHHHHGNPNELDVVIMPVKSLDDADITTARDAAVLVFSDWESRTKDGDTIAPGATLHRLLLADGNGKYQLKVAAPGQFLVFESCGHDPLHIYSGGEIVKPGWQRDYHAAHEHNDAVTSVGITAPGDLDGNKLNDWISELLRTKGGDLYRMKGVLAVKGTNKRLVFQGVHMLFDAKFDREWGASPRTNTLVFIGKNLDRPALTEAFKACLVN